MATAGASTSSKGGLPLPSSPSSSAPSSSIGQGASSGATTTKVIKVTGGGSGSHYYGPWLIEPADCSDSFLDGETAVKNLTDEQIEEFRKAFK